MSINVNKITSTLAKLGDTELQQYAQMHKNDPYIMALAMSESNRRKEIRDADQAAQGMQEQPKVVDRMLAEMGDVQNASPEQMARLSQLLEARKQAEYEEFTGGRQAQPAPQQLPEDMGIARIPAGEMNFAGGGIVAFADGGDVERYSGEFGSLTGGMLDAAQARAQAAQQRLYTYGLRQRQQDPAGFQTAQQELAAAQAALQAAERQLSGGPVGLLAQPLGAVPASAPVMDTGDETKRLAARYTAPAPAVAPKTGDAATKAGAGRKDTAPKETAEPSAKPDTGGLDSLIKDVTRQTDLAQGELRNLRAGQIAELNAAAAAQQAEGEQRRRERGDVFAGREARLAEREQGVAGMKDKNFGLALLQAGAAMMSTPGNLGTAIGKGVQVGSERYIAGIDKINAAKDKFAEARDRLDDLRINRDDMNAKEIREENAAIRNARLQGLQLLTDGATNDLKMTVENQRAFLGLAAESILTDRRIQGQKDVARITTAPALQRNAVDNKVRTEYGRLQTKVMETLSKDDNYKMATPAQQQVMRTNALRQELMNNPFLSSYAAGIGFSSTPTGGKVYDLTGG